MTLLSDVLYVLVLSGVIPTAILLCSLVGFGYGVSYLRRKCYVCGQKGPSLIRSWLCDSNDRGARCSMVWYCSNCYSTSTEALRGRAPEILMDMLSELKNPEG